ncbi:MAG: nitrite reductase/ring-hydroxylating ferredoxin subunit [Acidimicrobiales bacterium]|jgi:nitrite reductase/ring-hydroxylating ferredoxin subunit
MSATEHETNGTPGRTFEATVASVNEMDTGSMKMAKVGERRVVVIRSASGFYALDNACPHQGYGLATGSLDGELLTCQWHNWKFRASDGTCVIGQENVASHGVRIEGDDVIVSITEPAAQATLAGLWPSLQSGIERDYTGQMARDTARLLQAGASPEEILAVGLRHGLPRSEWGMGHDMAVAADLLHLADGYDHLEKTLPLTQALSGFSESNRDRQPHDVPAPADAPIDEQGFVDAVEREDEAGAVNAVRSLLASDDLDKTVPIARSWFVHAVSRHHYNYGHGAIYTQKAFTLIERIPEIAELLLTELAMTLVYGTREDTLPYMRKANRAIDKIDLDALAAAAGPAVTGWSDTDEALINRLLDADQAPIDQLVEAAMNGAGVTGLINTVSMAASHRLLRYDLTIERDRHEEFGWLDITHVLTYANAARWAWATNPGARSARLVLLTIFLAFDSGRGERRIRRVDAALPDPESGDIVTAVLERRPDDAVAAALAGPLDHVGDQLEQASLEDTAGSFIMMAHLVKTAVAAREEAHATGSLLPLAAAARFLAAPRAERFVTFGAREAIDFVRTGQPPTR